MSKTPLKKEIAQWLSTAIGPLASAAPGELEASLEPPKEKKFGDLSTSIILRLAKEAKKAPRPMADEVAKELTRTLAASSVASRVTKVSVEGPGFLNFYYSHEEMTNVLLEIHVKKNAFGRPDIQGRKILLEYVSANPTGPLTVAHGRQAALGDSLARVLRFCGHQVTTEYYNNDEGVQIQTLGKSTFLRAREIIEKKTIELPENYYQGDYLKEIAQKALEDHPHLTSNPKGEEICMQFAAAKILDGIRRDLEDFDVHFDNIYSQKELGHSGKVEKTLEELRKRGVTKEEEGALWLKSTEFGDDKDRVLIKSDKNYTYLTPDIAYHHEKFARGFEALIDILGPDHHGYIARLKASQAALGHDPELVRVLIAQLVTLYEGTKQVRMSTRAGEFVTLRQILDEVGKDAGRFFFVMRKFDAHLDFDLALAKSQTPDNPVFYIQYAHARIESIRNQKGDPAAKSAPDAKTLSRLEHPAEVRLLRLLSQYQDALLATEKTLEPYRLVPYLMDLAGSFHRFYTENRVVTEDIPLTRARLFLVEGVQSVLKSGLNLLGVSAPLKM